MDEMNFGNTNKFNSRNKLIKNREKLYKNWCFTLNNYNMDDWTKLKTYFINNKMEYIIGKEIGEQGTHHLQGYFEWNNKDGKRLENIKKINETFYKLHLENRKGSREQAVKYCAKDNEYICSNKLEKLCESWEYTGNDLPKEVDFYEWEQKLLEILKRPINNRKIIWIYDIIGNVGKTMFSKWLCFYENASIVQKGKYNDIMNYVYNVKKLTTLIIDVPRSSGNNVSYNAIESIKSGIICNMKYETGMKLINAPNVIVFSNEYPDIEMLSKDRWEIYEIKDKKLKYKNIEKLTKIDELEPYYV